MFYMNILIYFIIYTLSSVTTPFLSLSKSKKKSFNLIYLLNTSAIIRLSISVFIYISFLDEY